MPSSLITYTSDSNVGDENDDNIEIISPIIDKDGIEA